MTAHILAMYSEYIAVFMQWYYKYYTLMIVPELRSSQYSKQSFNTTRTVTYTNVDYYGENQNETITTNHVTFM